MPEATGAWCYYDTELGDASWFPPLLSTPLQSRTRALLPSFVFDSPPPSLDDRLSLSNLRGTSWIAIYEDYDHRIRLFNTATGSERYGPWISLRTSRGGVFFANLITRETRWFPPHRWMASWVSRLHADGTGSPLIDLYPRSVMSPAVSRLCVEGGAPYLDSHLTGRPQYEPDILDTQHSYPDFSLRASPLTRPEALRAISNAATLAFTSGPANML